MLGTPLLLASAWAFVPALLAVIGIGIRTVLEDVVLGHRPPLISNRYDLTRQTRLQVG